MPSAWIPETDFERADFPVSQVKNSDKTKKSVPKDKTSNAAISGKNVKSWRPPGINQSVKAKEGLQKMNSSITGEEQDLSRGSVIKKEDLGNGHIIHNAYDSLPPSIQPADPTQKFIQEMIISFPENTVYLLRNWYFQSPASGEIHPHDKILIILASAGQKITTYLLGVMSPVERSNISEILKRPANFNSDVVFNIRKEFMDRVSEF